MHTCITESTRVIILEGIRAALLFRLAGLGLSVIMSTEGGSAVTGSILYMACHTGHVLPVHHQISHMQERIGYKVIGLSSEASEFGLEDTGLIDLIVND
jgi:hypothetical protein